MRIALMATCLVDALFPPVSRATVVVLERLGHEVFEEALTTCDVVVAPSGSCVGAVKHQHAMVAWRVDTPALARRAEAVAARTELLGDVLGVTDVGSYYPHRVVQVRDVVRGVPAAMARLHVVLVG